MSIKYRELAKIISEMNEEQKDMDVTVYLQSTDEFTAVEEVGIVTGSDNDVGADVLDETHPYLVIDW
jgi:hypothetical protein